MYNIYVYIYKLYRFMIIKYFDNRMNERSNLSRINLYV